VVPVSAIPVIVQFRPLIDLIQKFRLSDSTIDSNYSLNSVDVMLNGGHVAALLPYSSGQLNGRPDVYPPPPNSSGQFVWVPRDSYVKPSGGRSERSRQGPRSSEKVGDHNRDRPNSRERNSRGTVPENGVQPMSAVTEILGALTLI
jgi:hypothetical protein